MKALSKFFTPPLSRRDRDTFYECLGLSEFDYFFMEACGSLVLRAKRMHGLKGNTLLSATLAGAPTLSPLLLRRYDSQQLPEESVNGAMSLWEEVFPYPFSLIGRLFADEKQTSLSLNPSAMKSRLKLLWESLLRLEEKMSATEVSCLWVKGQIDEVPTELPILFHYVRRRRVRVGTAPYLLELGESYRAGKLTPEILRQHFGTHCAFYYLNLEGLGQGTDLLNSLVDRILRLLEASESSPVIIGSPLSPTREPAPSFEL